MRGMVLYLDLDLRSTGWLQPTVLEKMIVRRKIKKEDRLVCRVQDVSLEISLLLRSPGDKQLCACTAPETV